MVGYMIIYRHWSTYSAIQSVFLEYLRDLVDLLNKEGVPLPFH